MAIRKEFSFPSRDGINTCHAYSWSPDDGNIRAIFQIVHGMEEYMDRYDDFASFMAGHGFLVVGEDHLGHGLTAATEKDLGYFAEHDAETILVRDVHRLKNRRNAFFCNRLRYFSHELFETFPRRPLQECFY